MTRCSVINCPTTLIPKYRVQHKISLHRIPSRESLKKKWIDSIGAHNLTYNKQQFVCSLHFEDSLLNNTLNVPRLRDNAIPTRFLFRDYTGNDSDSYKACSTASDDVKLKHEESPSAATTIETMDVKINKVVSLHDVPNVDLKSQIAEYTAIINKLSKKREKQLKILKLWHERCLRRSKQITNMTKIIKNLRNETLNIKT